VLQPPWTHEFAATHPPFRRHKHEVQTKLHPVQTRADSDPTGPFRRYLRWANSAVSCFRNCEQHIPRPYGAGILDRHGRDAPDGIELRTDGRGIPRGWFCVQLREPDVASAGRFPVRLVDASRLFAHPADECNLWGAHCQPIHSASALRRVVGAFRVSHYPHELVRSQGHKPSQLCDDRDHGHCRCLLCVGGNSGPPRRRR